MRPWLALAALWLTSPALAAEVVPTVAPASGAAAASVTEVSGTVTAVDLVRHRLTIDTAGGPAELGWDRNTLIYQPGGATTASAVRPGWVVRAGLDAGRTAYWIQVRPPSPPPAPPPPPPGR